MQIRDDARTLGPTPIANEAGRGSAAGSVRGALRGQPLAVQMSMLAPRVLQRQAATPTDATPEVTPETPPVDDVWQQFAVAFSQEFRSLLPIFDATLNVDRQSDRARRPAPRPRGRNRRATPAQTDTAAVATPATSAQADPVLSAELVSTLFTEEQRQLLMDFMATHMIPNRLFNGGAPVGGLSEGQRIAISGHILSKGYYRRGNVIQRVHGRNCGNWVGIMLQYAGLSTRLGGGGGANTNYDFLGNLLTSSATATQDSGGPLYRPEHLPTTEGATIGPMQGEQASAYGRAQAAQQQQQADPTHPARPMPRFGRMGSVSWGLVQRIQTGDWVWEYNANSDRTGMHSVIFIRWLKDERVDTVHGAPLRNRSALCMSQGAPDRPAAEHEVRFGERYDATLGTRPVNRIHRTHDASEDAGPKGILPRMDRKERAKLSETNRKIIRRLERKHNKVFDKLACMAYLREENARHIDTLDHRMSRYQRAEFDALNASTELEKLLQLLGRLRQMIENGELLDAGVANQLAGPRGLTAQREREDRRIAVEEERSQVCRPRGDRDVYSFAQAGPNKAHSEWRATMPINLLIPDLTQFLISKEAAPVPTPQTPNDMTTEMA